MNPIAVTIRSGKADATGTFSVDGGGAIAFDPKRFYAACGIATTAAR